MTNEPKVELTEDDTRLNTAQVRLNSYLSGFGAEDQKRILRYALDHVVPRMKPAPATPPVAPEPAGRAKALVQQIKEQAQVYASAWSLVGGPFDAGQAMEDAGEAKHEHHALVDQLAALTAHPQGEPQGEPASQAHETARLRAAIKAVCREAHSATRGIVDLHIIDGETDTQQDAPQAPERAGAVAEVRIEPDYWSRGHFYEGRRKIVVATQSVEHIPVGAKLYAEYPECEHWRKGACGRYEALRATPEWREVSALLADARGIPHNIAIPATPKAPERAGAVAACQIISEAQIAQLEHAARGMEAIANKHRIGVDTIEPVRTINDAAKLAKVAHARVMNVLACLDLNDPSAVAPSPQAQLAEGAAFDEVPPNAVEAWNTRAAPTGWVSVPVEPTLDMLLAGSAAADGYGSPLTRTENAFKAMLAAAPLAQKEPPNV